MKPESYRSLGRSFHPLSEMPLGTDVFIHINGGKSHILSGAKVKVVRVNRTKQQGNEAVIVRRDGHEWSLGGGTAARAIEQPREGVIYLI